MIPSGGAWDIGDSERQLFEAAFALLQLNVYGAWLRTLEAVQTIYLHPRSTRPTGAGTEVGSDTLPECGDGGILQHQDVTVGVPKGSFKLPYQRPLYSISVP